MARNLPGKIVKCIVENVNDAAIGIDKEDRIIFLNAPAETLFGTSFKEVKKQKIWDVIGINEFTRVFVSLLKDLQPREIEQIFPLHENQVFLAKMIPIKENDDRFVAAVAILEDLTMLHKMEVTMNEFVTLVSHELKTPLTSIKGFVETLLEGALKDPEITRRFLQVINDETNRMTRLVISLMEITNLNRQAVSDNIKPTTPTEFICEIVSLLIPLATEKNVKIISKIEANMPSLLVNPDKMRQALLNVIDNAIKYTGINPQGGVVNISAYAEDKNLKIIVKDNGIGIPEDELDKIFDKFYRISKGPSAQLGGTGLGLTISREIINSYGGKISVESEFGKGSTFTIVIPKNMEA